MILKRTRADLELNVTTIADHAIIISNQDRVIQTRDHADHVKVAAAAVVFKTQTACHLVMAAAAVVVVVVVTVAVIEPAVVAIAATEAEEANSDQDQDKVVAVLQDTHLAIKIIVNKLLKTNKSYQTHVQRLFIKLLAIHTCIYIYRPTYTA